MVVSSRNRWYFLAVFGLFVLQIDMILCEMVVF